MTRKWHFAALILLGAAGALAIRLPLLDLRPMHTDEAVHAVKFNTLWETGQYRYDVYDYHGPTLYYCTLPSVWLSGANNFSETTEATYRIVPVLFGVALVLLLGLIGDGLGRKAALWAAMLTALSPAMVYYSRYYIQEMLLAFFTFAVIVAGWRYVRSRHVVWALLAGAGCGFMHATKETCVIAFGAMAVALVGTLMWNHRLKTGATLNGESQSDATLDGPRGLKPAARLGRRIAVGRSAGWAIGGAVVLGAMVSVLCFSAFFTNASGPLDSLRAVASYFDRAGGNGVHEHPWYYYLKMLLYTHYSPGPVWSEGLTLALAVIGAVTVLTGRELPDVAPTLVRFLVLFALLMTIAYSAIPYKTPWCMIEFLHPLILLAGVGAVSLIGWPRIKAVRAVVWALLLIGVADLGRQAHAASFRFPADNRNPYAYAHPVSGVKRLTAWVERLAEVHPDGRQMLIKVIMPDCWPLPWHLRGFERVGYWEKPTEEPDAPVIIVASELQPALADRLQNAYKTSHYGLRPGAVLLVYVDRKLYDAFADQQRSGEHTGGEDEPK